MGAEREEDWVVEDDDEEARSISCRRRFSPRNDFFSVPLLLLCSDSSGSLGRTAGGVRHMKLLETTHSKLLDRGPRTR